LCLLGMALAAAACGGAGAAGLPQAAGPASQADPRLLPLGSSLPFPADLDDTGRGASQADGGGGTLDFPGAVFLNAAGGTVDGDTLVLQSSADEPAWAIYKADGLAGLKIDAFGVETVPGDLDTQYSVGLSNFSDGRWDYFINTVLPEVEIDLSDNTKRLVSHLGNLYWVVVVDGGKSVRVVAGHVFTGLEHDGDWCPELVSGLSVSQGLPDHIHVEWNARECARKYELWGRLAPDQGDRGASCWYYGHGTDWVKVAETSDNYFDDYDIEAGQWYEYKVRARNHCGWGGFSGVERGYMGTEPGGGDEGQGCDAEGVIASLDEQSLVLEDGTAFAVAAETQWLLPVGSSLHPAGVAPGDRVAVDGAAGEGGMCVAVSVTLLEESGTPIPFDAESAIDVRDGGLLRLQNGMAFTYGPATEWLDADGNPLPLEEFVPLVRVHAWGEAVGMGAAHALKVQLLPPDPAG
jgi:hypothetical protein